MVRYFLASRLLVCDFKELFALRAKLRLVACDAARRLLTVFGEPPLDKGLIWSTSTLSGSVPCAFS